MLGLVAVREPLRVQTVGSSPRSRIRQARGIRVEEAGTARPEPLPDAASVPAAFASRTESASDATKPGSLWVNLTSLSMRQC